MNSGVGREWIASEFKSKCIDRVADRFASKLWFLIDKIKISNGEPMGGIECCGGLKSANATVDFSFEAVIVSPGKPNTFRIRFARLLEVPKLRWEVIRRYTCG